MRVAAGARRVPRRAHVIRHVLDGARDAPVIGHAPLELPHLSNVEAPGEFTSAVIEFLLAAKS